MKRRISLLVVLAMLMSFVSVFNVNAAFSDVSSTTKYSEAITKLSKLNVINGYEDGTFGPEKEITRAEFTKLIVYMLGYGSLSTKITQFEDVSQDHWANANIRTAYDMGIVNGFDDVTFKPDDPVTYEQALKMVVCTLGYTVNAEKLGGYPAGYRQQAINLELTKGISDISYEQNATRGVVAQVMYNALEVDMQEVSNTSIQSSGKNLLNDYLNVYQIKGTIVGVEDSKTSECTIELLQNQLDIKDSKGNEYVIIYENLGKTFAEMNKYLGQTVNIFYRQDKSSEDKFLIEIDNETVKNSETTISWKNLASYSNGNLKYYKEDTGRTFTANLDQSDLSVRYNGRVVPDSVDIDGTSYTTEQALEKWLDESSSDRIYGTVKLIDSGSTGRYNIIDIYDYENIVAYAVPTKTDYRITDKTVTGNYLILDPDNSDYKFTLEKDAKSIETTGIAKDDVITYAKSLDGELITAYATAKSVKGTVTSINTTDANNMTIAIDGTEYQITSRFLTYLKNKEQKELKTGVELTAYQDYLGALEWGTVTTTSKYYPYAYVIDSAQDGEDYYIKLFAPTSTSLTSFSSSTSYKAKSFKIANNVKLNSKKTSPESLIAALQETAKTANPDAQIEKATITLTGINQLVRVLFNSDGELSEVITINASAEEGSKNDDNGALVRFKQMDPTKKYYVTTSSVKESSTGTTYYSIKSATPMFVIPMDRSKSDDYSLKSAITSNTMYTGGTYYLDAYDLNETRYPGCVLVYNTTFKTGTAITMSTAYRLVSDNIQEEYDETEGDIYKKLYSYNTATTVTKTNISSSYESEMSDVGKGDVILYGTDGDKAIDSHIKAIDYDDIRRILDGETVEVTKEDGSIVKEKYNWNETQEQTAENHWQKYVFDFRYPKTNITGPTDNYYLNGGNATNISSRACMYNLVQVVTGENVIYVTKNGFDEDGKYDDSSYEEIKVSTSTKYIRYDSDKKEFTPYAPDTEKTNIKVDDLKGAVNYGDTCSKIMVTYVSGTTTSSTSTPTAKFIVIYE